MSDQPDITTDEATQELLDEGLVELVPLTAAEHRAVAVDLLHSLTYAGRGSAELELVKATAALAHATLGGQVPEDNDARAEEIEKIASRRGMSLTQTPSDSE